MTHGWASNAEFHGMKAHDIHDLTRRDVQMSGNDVLNVLVRDNVLSGLLGTVAKKLNPIDLVKKMPELIKKVDPIQLAKKIPELIKVLAQGKDAGTVKNIATLISQLLKKGSGSGSAVGAANEVPAKAAKPDWFKGLLPHNKRDNEAAFSRDVLNELTTELHALYRHGQQESAKKEDQDKLALVQAVTQLVAISAVEAAN